MSFFITDIHEDDAYFKRKDELVGNIVSKLELKDRPTEEGYLAGRCDGRFFYAVKLTYIEDY